MQRISWKQTKAVLKALDVLYSDSEPATLPARILGAVQTAVASETILIDSFSAQAEMNPLAQYPANSMSPQEYGMLAQHLPQHPLFPLVILKKRTTPFRTKEVTSGTNFHRTPLYNEMFRPMSISDQIIMRINGSHGAFLTCCLNRVKQEFSEADRRAVNLINSHLASAVGSAQTLQAMRSAESFLLTALESACRGIVVLDAGGEIKYITDSAASLLRKYFWRRDFSSKKLPETINGWAKQLNDSRRRKDFQQPVPPIVLKGADTELRITLSLNKGGAERILLLEEKRTASPVLLQTLGLTRREAEILFWVAQGKPDSIVGVLCGISPRTVQIHLGHVYTKLGVENRTAATLRALELLQI